MGETIGKVFLDTTYYPGQDLYSDGAIEDEMLAIARDCAPEEFNSVIRDRESWPILYHSVYRGGKGSRDRCRMRSGHGCSVQKSKRSHQH